jgi:hypothetical protein
MILCLLVEPLEVGDQCLGGGTGTGHRLLAIGYRLSAIPYPPRYTQRADGVS